MKAQIIPTMAQIINNENASLYECVISKIAPTIDAAAAWLIKLKGITKPVIRE